MFLPSTEDSYRRYDALNGRLDETRNDPVFLSALEAAGDRMLTEGTKALNLFVLIRDFLPSLPHQSIIECGCYRGGSVLFMATLLKHYHPHAKVYALDTFEGMPDTHALDLHRKGEFADADLDGFRSRLAALGLDNVVILKGLVEDTTKRLPDGGGFGLFHLDLDLYEPLMWAQDEAWRLLCPGGYIVYDDANAPSCLGATRAMEDLIIHKGVRAEQAWPHFVFRRH